MAPGVKFPGETNVWAPVPSTRARPPTYVRLAKGATIDQLAGAFPELRFSSLRAAIHPGEGRALMLLFGAAVVLLVVTWIQVAALMFSGSLGQLREMGVRLALGAGRVHLIRQFAIESALTAGAAFGLAWLVVGPLTGFIASMLPVELSHGQYLGPDLRTFLFGCAISLVGFGLLTVAPLGVARRVAPLGLLNGRFADKPFRVERLRHALLVGQMTLTSLLLYLSGLAAHSFMQAAIFDYGFDAEHVLVFTPPQWARLNSTNAQLFADFDERNRKVTASVEILQSVSGVISAATFHVAPLRVGLQRPGGQSLTRYGGRLLPDLEIRDNSVGVDFVRAFGATMIAGQSFNDPEFAGRDDVAVVNETLARRLSPPITLMGEELTPSVIGSEIQGPHFRARIIGVIKDLVDTTPDVPADPQVYSPDRRSSAATAVAVRVSTSVDAALPAIRAAMEHVWARCEPDSSA